MPMLESTTRRGSALAALLASAPLAAQGVETLERINVTAERLVQEDSETLASFEVIDRSAIERSQAKSLMELLRGLAGVDFANQGGYGKPTSLFLRGTNPGQVMVMIDGVRAGSATLGTFSWQYLPLGQVERIEVVRGPRSHLYGSEAVGGVIHIFTRRGEEGSAPDGRLEAGSDDSYGVQAGFSAGRGTTGVTLAVARFDTTGYDATVGNNPDRDGYSNDSVSGRFTHGFDGGSELSVNLFRAEGDNEYDGFSATDDYDADYLQQNLGGRLRLQLTGNWRADLEIGEYRDQEKDFVNGEPSARFETRRREIAWINHLALGGGGDLSVGLEGLRDRVEGSSDYAENERYNNAAFLRFGRAFGDGRLSAGLRYDDNEAFGGQGTGNVAWGQGLPGGLVLSAAYGSAFKAPTFNDLYYQSPWGSNGNPDLEPETSDTWELGLRGASGGTTWDLRVFRTDAENLIQWVEQSPFVWQPENVAEARIDGIEFSASAALADWDVDVALTLLDPEDRATGNTLPRRSRQTARVDLARDFGGSEAGLTWLAQGHRFDDPENRVRLAGYGLLDLRYSYRPAQGWEIGIKVSNLFDKAYQTAAGYRMPGREVFAALSYRGG